MFFRRFLVAVVMSVAFVLGGCEDKCQTGLRELECEQNTCEAGTYWTPGTQAFREATADWALETPTGRMQAVDFSGDGLTDLVVVRVSGTAADRWVSLLRNTGHSFQDVTDASGFLVRRSGEPGYRQVQVVTWGDVDNDGDLDAFTGTNTVTSRVAEGERSEIMFNNGSGQFALGPAENGVNTLRRQDPSGASFADIDRDGLIDLWLVTNNSEQSRLLRNTGGGVFEDATSSLGLTTVAPDNADAIGAGDAHLLSAWSGAACDLNDDGNPELLGASYNRAPNQLFQARRSESGAIRYDNRSVASGYAYDDDLTWQNNQAAMCYCTVENPNAEGCADAQFARDGNGELPAGLVEYCEDQLALGLWVHSRDIQVARLGGNSGTTLCADFDNDSDVDLVTCEIKHEWAGDGADGSQILLNTGRSNVTFERQSSARSGLVVPHETVGWDEGIITAASLDFDNDGWLDLYWGNSEYQDTRGLLYHQVEGPSGRRPYFELTPAAETIDNNRSAHVVAADFDRDGDVDVIAGHSSSRCAASPGDTAPCYGVYNVRFFENTMPRGNFIQLRLVGSGGTNRSAIGARIRVTTPAFTQTRHVLGGWGHYSEQGDLLQYVGLGADCQATVEIRWPDAALSTETFTLNSGNRYRVTQGAGVQVERP